LADGNVVGYGRRLGEADAAAGSHDETGVRLHYAQPAHTIPESVREVRALP